MNTHSFKGVYRVDDFRGAHPKGTIPPWLPYEFLGYHFRCTKIYMGNGLVDNSTVPNCPMPNCASRNRSPTSFAKNPEELRPLAWRVFFQCSGGVWCEVMEKLWLLIVKKPMSFEKKFDVIACICLWLPFKNVTQNYFGTNFLTVSFEERSTSVRTTWLLGLRTMQLQIRQPGRTVGVDEVISQTACLSELILQLLVIETAQLSCVSPFPKWKKPRERPVPGFENLE